MTKRLHSDKLKYMWEMRKLLVLLKKYPYTEGVPQMLKFEFQMKGIDQKDFVMYLEMHTDFKKNWVLLLHEFRYRFSRKQNHFSGTNDKYVNLYQKRGHDIELVIDSCRENGYLDPNNKGRLVITGKGYQFTKNYPNFLNEWYKEKPLWSSGIIPFLTGSIGTQLVVYFWQPIKEFILKLTH